MQVVVTWSGGKDSCFALYKAMLEIHHISYLLNFTLVDRPSYHGSPELIRAQSQAIGIPLIQKEANWSTYERELKSIIRNVKQLGVQGVVFGDIHLREHRDWIERVCRQSDAQWFFPLWHMDPERTLRDFIDLGFEAIVVSAKAEFFDENWLGRKMDQRLIEDLCNRKKKLSIDLCGEFGEYHTLVTNGPIFKKQIEVLDTDTTLENGYWFLEIRKYRMIEKKNQTGSEVADGKFPMMP